MAVEFRSVGGSHGPRSETKERARPQHTEPEAGVGPDDTLPPTPASDLFASHVLSVYVLAADPAVLDAVERACGGRYPLCRVADWRTLLTAVEARRCDIAFIEAELLGDRLAKCISELERHAQQVVTLVAADRSDAQDLIGLLSARKIHRLLIKPPAPGITRLLLESAASRCLQLRAAASNEPMVPLVREAPRPSGVRVPTWVLATGVAALVLAVVMMVVAPSLWNLLPNAGRATHAEAMAPAAAPDRFAELLSLAEVAFNEGRLAEPPSDNALDYYLAVLAADPTHEKARDRLSAVVDALFAQAENALLSGSLDTAATALANVRRAAPTSGRLAFLDTQLARARADAAKPAARAARATGTDVDEAAAAGQMTPAARAALEQSLTSASARLRRGELIDPAGDSALDNVARASELNAADPRVRRTRTELASALVASARAVLDAGDVDSGVRLVRAAQTLGTDGDTVALLEQRVAAARDTRTNQIQVERVAAARLRIQAGALTAPSADNALSLLTTVEAEAPQTPGLADAWRALVAALESNARAAIASHDWTAADASVAAIRTTGQAVSLADSLAREIGTARLQQQYLATAAPASELNLASYAAPVYPADALRRQIEGWVDLEFVVDRTGRPRDLVVVRATPTGPFEQAALDAVAKYRYEPFSRDGQVYERRVRLRLRFNLK